MPRRRTRAQIARALADLERAVRFAREVQEDHADHPHYNGVCFHTNVDTRDGQIILMDLPRGSRARQDAREHQLAHFVREHADRIRRALGPSR